MALTEKIEIDRIEVVNNGTFKFVKQLPLKKMVCLYQKHFIDGF
jgi:uncharacterized FlaG/YvyC family protein